MLTTRMLTRRAVIGASLLVLLSGLSAEEPRRYSVIAGTVFREPGFALPGASVTLEQLPPAAPAEKPKKLPKPLKTTTDSRGEYAFRMPANEHRFRLSASARGMTTESKEAAAAPGVRIDVFFELKPVAVRP